MEGFFISFTHLFSLKRYFRNQSTRFYYLGSSRNQMELNSNFNLDEKQNN
jgi:hypothetical protein